MTESVESDLETLILLVSVQQLPALEVLCLCDGSAGPDGVQRLMAGLGAGALPALTCLDFLNIRMGNAGASSLAAALGRGDLLRLKSLRLNLTAMTDAGLMALAPALSVLPALKELLLNEHIYLAEGQTNHQPLRLMVGLGAGALPYLTTLSFERAAAGPRRRRGLFSVGDAGASALAAALGRGAVPRLTDLSLRSCGIGDAGLVALAPALRRLRRLKRLDFSGNPLGDEGLATLVAPAGALAWVLTPVLTKLEVLDLHFTHIKYAGCAALASALDSGMLPALKTFNLADIPGRYANSDILYTCKRVSARGYHIGVGMVEP